MNNESCLKWTYHHTVDEVIKEWNHLYWIYQDHDTFMLIKYKRKDSPILTIKWVIPQKEAMELIVKLSLTQYPSHIFRNSSSWRKEKHHTLLSDK